MMIFNAIMEIGISYGLDDEEVLSMAASTLWDVELDDALLIGMLISCILNKNNNDRITLHW